MYFEALASGGGSDWYYTILMKAPLGAAITVDDGDEEVEATGAGMDNLIGIPVHNDSSTYTISVKMNGLTAPMSTITTPATSGGISSVVEVPFAKISLTYEDNFRGQALSVSDGTHTASPSPVMPVLGNALDIYVPYTGDWTLEATDPVSGNQFNSSPNPVPVSSLDQTVSAGLFVIPDGKTVLPVNDIALWLACADIKDVSYTTLEEVLADENTLRRLLTDDNTIDYLKRSKSFINAGVVPKMTDDTTPSGRVTAQSVYSLNNNYLKWMAFNEYEDNGWLPLQTNSLPQWIQYEFDSPTMVKKIGMRFVHPSQSYNGIVKVQGSNDNFVSDIHDLADNLSVPYQVKTNKTLTLFDLSDVDEYKYYRVTWKSTTASSMTDGAGLKIQLFEFTEGITDSETAMSYIGAYDYAANTLLGDADWYKSIVDSAYVEKVVNPVVPILSSASSDIIYDSQYSNYYPYYAFDDNASTVWISTNTAFPHYIGYKNSESVKVIGVKFYPDVTNDSLTRINNFKIQGSKDGSSWDDVYTGVAENLQDYQYFSFDNDDSYIYYRAVIVDSYDSSVNYSGFATLQFYSRETGGVQTLLKAAGIARPYTTLDELFADKEALAMVIGSHAAIDYLVTVKDWIDEFTSNEMAMMFIGGDNYAADTLLSDSDWAEGICNSDYMEEVISSIIPLMTSNTTPTGYEVSGNADPSTNVYRAFTNQTGGYVYWYNNNSGYCIMKLPEAICVKYLKFIRDHFPFEFWGSNDNTNWDKLASYTDTSAMEANVILDNNTEYQYYKITSTSAYGSAQYVSWNDIKIYGREDVTEGVHIFSAASDTIYDQNNQVIATTDTSGHALVSKSNLPNGTYTLRSTVAKDPDNLSNDFTKVVEVTDATKCIMFMPDNALYWYGCEIESMSVYLSANLGGGTHCTKETNHLEMVVGGNGTQYAVVRKTSAMDLTGYSKVNFVLSKTCYPTTGNTGTAYWGIGTAEDNNTFSESDSASGNNGNAKRTVNITSSSGCPKAYANHNSSSGFSTTQIKAIYFE